MKIPTCIKASFAHRIASNMLMQLQSVLVACQGHAETVQASVNTPSGKPKQAGCARVQGAGARAPLRGDLRDESAAGEGRLDGPEDGATQRRSLPVDHDCRRRGCKRKPIESPHCDDGKVQIACRLLPSCCFGDEAAVQTCGADTQRTGPDVDTCGM